MNGVIFHQVKEGTELKCRRTHQKFTVKDNEAIFGYGECWVTPKVFQALRDHIPLWSNTASPRSPYDLNDDSSRTAG